MVTLVHILVGSLVEFHQSLPEQLNPKVRNLVILSGILSAVPLAFSLGPGSHAVAGLRL